MIRKPTVLVLGAGASAPYGFPTAYKMVTAVEAEIEGGGPITTTLAQMGFPPEESERFFRTLVASGQYSIDAFIQRSPTFRPIGKAAMVAQLIPKEYDPSLVPGETEDWYRALFVRMAPKQPGFFSANQLSVITFNFDRSYERRLFLFLMANYNLTELQAREVMRPIPILHIHGKLGGATWLGEEGRAYSPNVDTQTLLSCADQIRVADDEIDEKQRQWANDLLTEAERVCFIGFSFHPDNLQRFPAGLGQKILCGTCHGLPNDTLASTYQHFNSPRANYLLTCPARRFFDEVNLD